MVFQLKPPFSPCGDQPQAIQQLTQGVLDGKSAQVLLGITGSGKTFTIANVIANVGIPTLILAHNKTLAAQLYQEFKEFFPDNAVEYFISYYDYYQPEAYIARNDTYIEKSLLINDEIEKLRLSATKSLLERPDTIIISSVSCIYGIGSPENFASMTLTLKINNVYPRKELLNQLIFMHYIATTDPQRSAFRDQGAVLDIFPSYDNSLAIRLEFSDDTLETIHFFDPITLMVLKKNVTTVNIFPGSHYVIPLSVREQAIQSIQIELQERLSFFEDKPLEKDRLFQRTTHDIEMIREVGFCKGIENYSRHFTQMPPGEPPHCLLDYFPEDFLFIIDESHQSLPQLRAMYNGDLSRKKSLVEFGFRLPSAYDNRPLTYKEAKKYFKKVIYVSATPGSTEIEESRGSIIEQIIRPTGIPDPIPEVRPATNQIDNLLEEIQKRLSQSNEKIFVISLTKKLAEDIASFLSNLSIPCAYLHSEIDTAERTQILTDLRIGKIDVIIGVNLLREGLDLPEVSLVAILDADKEGFLRSTSSLIQFCGRAARNVNGKVILYADRITKSIQETLDESNRRQKIQLEYNKIHNITPKSIIKNIHINPIKSKDAGKPILSEEILSQKDIENFIKKNEKLMIKASKEFRFEDAAKYRDLIQEYKQKLILNT